MLRSVSTVTFATPDFDASCVALIEELGLARVETGSISAELANFWNAPAVAGAQFASFQSSSGEPVFVRLIESPETPGFEPLRCYGWNAAEFLVRDVAGLAERLQSSPLKILGGPRDLLNNGVAIALQARGPSDEVFYLTELNGKRMQATYGKAEADVDRIFIVVLGVSDMQRSREFYAKLAKATPRPRRMTIRVLAAAHGLDPMSHEFPIASAVLEDQFRIEFDGYPESATPRPQLPGYLPPGMAMVSFRVDSLENIVDADIQEIEGSKRALLQGPDAELVELVELVENSD